MKGFLAMFDRDYRAYVRLVHDLGRIGYPCRRVESLQSLGNSLKREGEGLLLVDFDNLDSVGDFLTFLRKELPCVRIIGMSRKHFHPELKDAFRRQIFACVRKPLNLEEVEFLVKSFFQDVLGESE